MATALAWRRPSKRRTHRERRDRASRAAALVACALSVPSPGSPPPSLPPSLSPCACHHCVHVIPSCMPHCVRVCARGVSSRSVTRLEVRAQGASFSSVGVMVWSERWRAGQRPVSMTATGGPLGARHNRSAPHVGKREAACFGAVGVEKVVQGSPGVEGFPQKLPRNPWSASPPLRRRLRQVTRQLKPNRVEFNVEHWLVTGVLGCACLGTCVFRLHV